MGQQLGIQLSEYGFEPTYGIIIEQKFIKVTHVTGPEKTQHIVNSMKFELALVLNELCSYAKFGKF